MPKVRLYVKKSNSYKTHSNNQELIRRVHYLTLLVEKLTKRFLIK